jgi:hypothetical protein
MSTIGGPGGIGGPSGPSRPDGPDELDGLSGTDAAGAAGAAGAASAAVGTSDLDVLAAEVAAGRLSPREAIDQLVEATATPELSAGERAELRELLSELVASDPFFASLSGRV